MCSNQIPNLMMQPQEYCSCVVCGYCVGNSEKSTAKSRNRRCTFDESGPESRYSETPGSEYPALEHTESSTAEESGTDTSCVPPIGRCAEQSSSDSKRSKKSSSSSCRTCHDSDSEKPIPALCPPDEPFDCNKTFTPSGMCPPKTAGPLGKRFDCCSKYAPCGHWHTCSDKGHQHDKLFEAIDTTETRAPYGPYGPWNKFGPSKFKIPLEDVVLRQFPKIKPCRNGLNKRKSTPMGKMRPWPLAGSCRYGGRPYGPCRPFGAYRSRGPFGVWEVGQCDVETIRRPSTPCQPCWKPKKPGYRPCTPCHRPLYRACREPCIQIGPCDYSKMTPVKCTPVCEN